jgi:hypothetical protein
MSFIAVASGAEIVFLRELLSSSSSDIYFGVLNL